MPLNSHSFISILTSEFNIKITIILFQEYDILRTDNMSLTDAADFPVYQVTDKTQWIVSDMKPLTKYLYAVRIHNIQGYPGAPTRPEVLEIPSNGMIDDGNIDIAAITQCVERQTKPRTEEWVVCSNPT